MSDPMIIGSFFEMPFMLRDAPLRFQALWALCLALGLGAPQAAAQPMPSCEQALVRMVRQDCGSCHGMHLTGGLGPALTPAALADKPVESLAATIYGGRPGTPMPPWKAMLSEAEAHWIAQKLLAGFPQEARK